jgi:hypothetical protein
MVVPVDLWAWTATDPGRLLVGATVSLGADGALLRLPDLPEDVERLTLRIGIPERAVLTEAVVVGRTSPDLVGVVFDGIDTYERARIRQFVARFVDG